MTSHDFSSWFLDAVIVKVVIPCVWAHKLHLWLLLVSVGFLTLINKSGFRKLEPKVYILSTLPVFTNPGCMYVSGTGYLWQSTDSRSTLDLLNHSQVGRGLGTCILKAPFQITAIINLHVRVGEALLHSTAVCSLQMQKVRPRKSQSLREAMEGRAHVKSPE